jgi:DNA-binding GntR family transcriptional regulator
MPRSATKAVVKALEPQWQQLEGLPTATLKGHVVDRIRQAILGGIFKPGERLNETQLANHFKVSRIPVREALLQLQEQGLVTNHPRRGMFVITLSEEDTQRINSLRILLESEAIKLCRTNLTATAEERLTALVEKMEHGSPESDLDASMLDIEFHRAIWAYSGNPYLAKTLNTLVTVLFSHQALKYLSVPGVVHWPLNHHRALLDVVRGKSKISPEMAMIDHLSVRYTNPERFSSFAFQRTQTS